MNNYEQYEVPNGVPVKMWTNGVPVEEEARNQLRNIARLPIVFKHVAVMTDVHLGIGATIGSVVPTLKAIIPAAVGVDLGCGMMACKTTLTASDLPDNLSGVRAAIERAVPVGMTPIVSAATRGAGIHRPPRPTAPGPHWWMSSTRFAKRTRASRTRTTTSTWERWEQVTTSSKSAWTSTRAFG